MSIFRSEGDDRVGAIKDCLSLLPPANYANLRYLVKFLSKLAANQAMTKMSPGNLAIVFGPNLIWSGSGGDGSFLGSKLVECLVNNADYFFPEGRSITFDCLLYKIVPIFQKFDSIVV